MSTPLIVSGCEKNKEQSERERKGEEERGQKTDDVTAGLWKLGQPFINAHSRSVSVFVCVSLSRLNSPFLFCFSWCMLTEQ